MTEADRLFLKGLITTSVLRPPEIEKGIAILDADKPEEEPTREDYEGFHAVLKRVREQMGSGSDLDILYRFGYWEAVKDHTHALACNKDILASLKSVIEQRDEAQEDCRMMQKRLQRLIDKKPTVPMTMLIDKPTEVMGDTMQGIKPCPFCGGKVYSMASPGVMWIQCGHCKAETRGAGDLAGAIAIWNRRTEIDAKPTVPMEMLRELNGDWVHSSLDYAVRESLIEIASRFGYEVTE